MTDPTGGGSPASERGASTGPLPPIIRWLAAALALVTALAAVLLALIYVEFSHPALGLGTVGAFAATMILLRVRRAGSRLARLDAAVLLVGLAAPVAAIAIFVQDDAGTMENGLRVAMRSDLRNLVAAEDAYFAEHQVYAARLADLEGRFQASAGVEITLDATGRGFRASARHDRIAAKCAVYVGDPRLPAGATEREPVCTR